MDRARGMWPPAACRVTDRHRNRAADLLRRGLVMTDSNDTEGMKVRREVLGDDHVDRATAGITDLTRDFQEFITRYAWGGVWTRPGLDRRMRSAVTLTALIAHGHWEELELH